MKKPTNLSWTNKFQRRGPTNGQDEIFSVQWDQSSETFLRKIRFFFMFHIDLINGRKISTKNCPRAQYQIFIKIRGDSNGFGIFWLKPFEKNFQA